MQIPNVCRAAATYNVPESTLRGQLAGKAAQRDCQPNLKKLTNPEEEAIIKHVLDLNLRGFPPSLKDVQYIANKLLAERGAQIVGMYWLQNFVKLTERITTHFSQSYD
jgi:hypothetical protein